MPRVAQQHLDQPFHHLHHVGAALAQVAVLDLVELLDHVIHLLNQRPFGVAASLTDQCPGGLDQHRVGQHHHLQIDEGADLGMSLGVAGGGDGLETEQFAIDRRNGLVKAVDLFFEISLRDVVVVDLQQRVRHQMHMADGNAR